MDPTEGQSPQSPVAGVRWKPSVSWPAAAGLAGFPGADPHISPIWVIMRWGRKPGTPELIAGELQWQPPSQVTNTWHNWHSNIISYKLSHSILLQFVSCILYRFCLFMPVYKHNICLSVGNNISYSWRRQRERSNKINRLWKHWKVNKFESTASCVYSPVAHRHALISYLHKTSA